VRLNVAVRLPLANAGRSAQPTMDNNGFSIIIFLYRGVKHSPQQAAIVMIKILKLLLACSLLAVR
jgi:hypothetical protein